MLSWDGESEQLEREDVVEGQGRGWWELQGIPGQLRLHSCSWSRLVELSIAVLDGCEIQVFSYSELHWE